MLVTLLIGAALTAATVVVHAAGTTWWIHRLRAFNARADAGNVGDGLGSHVLWITAVLLLGLHVVEVAIWAVVYLGLTGLNEVDDFEQAVYFSAVTFSSLGYGDIVIGGSWRLLSAIQAMTGLLVFGWSSALLFAVIQHMWKLPPVEPRSE